MQDDLDDWFDELQGELRYMTRQEFYHHVSMVRKNMKVWEGRKKGSFVVKIEHLSTGVVVERRCGASKDECRREAFRDLLRRINTNG